MARNDIGTRPDKHRVSLVVGNTDCGVWPKQTGGGKDSEESKYRPGGMQDEESNGGVTTLENVTLQRQYNHDLAMEIDRYPSGTRCRVIRQPLDNDGLAYGPAAIAWEGTLKAFNVPEVDADGGSDTALMELEITVDRRAMS